MEETEYLARIAALQAKRWHPDLPREPQYPFGKIPLTDTLRRWAAKQPEKAAVNFYGAELTYGELDRLSDRFAALLIDQGIGKGDRVAVYLGSCPQFLIVFFGILKLGAVHVPVNPMFKATELRYELKDSGARLIVCGDRLADLVEEVKPDTEIGTVIVTSLGEMAPAEPTMAVPPALLEEKLAAAGALDLLPALEATTTPFEGTEIGLDDIACLNYTGGTTGMPKGCIHTQGDMVYTAATTVPMAMKLTEEHRYLNVFPIFWVAGELLGIIIPIFAGATVVLMTRWDALAVMTAIDRLKVTHMSLVVDSIVEIIEHPRNREFDLSSLVWTTGISFVKKLNPDFRHRWRELTGLLIREFTWGMTETHTCDTVIYGFEDDDFDLKSQPIFVGFPVPGTEFKICDFETGALKQLGEEGELCIRSPSLLKGYWNRPEQSEQALRNGWLHTGDIGLYDEDGVLHFLGRRKEMLKVNGMSVFPGEIEAILGQYPGLLGSGVVGRPDPDKGEVPVAFIWLAAENRTPDGEEAFRTWCKETLSSYKRPELRFVDSLPMTDTGKVKKEELKKTL